MVITPPANVPVTPAGKPLTLPPVPLPPTAYVIFMIGVLIQTVWLFVPGAEVNVIVPSSVTVILPVAVGVTQGPVVVIV